MRYYATLDTVIYGLEHTQGQEVDVSAWNRAQIMQTLSLGVISPYQGFTNTANQLQRTDSNGDPYWCSNGTWIRPDLGSGWLDYDTGGTWHTAGYRMFSDGLVKCRGLIKSGATGVVFTLKEGFRPIMQETFLCPSATGFAQIDLLANGQLNLYRFGTGGSNAWVSLSSISFTTD